MGIMDRLFGRTRATVPADSGTGVGAKLRSEISQNLELLKYLCQCGKFDRDKMQTYITMAERAGKALDPQQKYQMLNAGTVLMPEVKHGTVVDGLEQMRRDLMGVHMQAVTAFIKVIKSLPPERANAQLLERVISELDNLQRYF